MRVCKDGKVWSAYDDDFGICVSGNTKEEAEKSIREAQAFLGAMKYNDKLRDKTLGDSKRVRV